MFAELETDGIKVRSVSIRRLRDLEDELAERRVAGAFAPPVDEMFGRHFDFMPPPGMPAPRSILVAAVRRGVTRATFTWRGVRRAYVMPPTYAFYDRTEERVRAALGAAVSAAGYAVAPAGLPLKLLAACSGLANYGRNNIAYVPGWGSCCQLVAAYSDAPDIDDADWDEPAELPRCESCCACLAACPTGAIDRQRFLLRAERCVTFVNERPGAFPAWIDPAWHTALVGCLHCQRVCPENVGLLDTVEQEVEFTDADTVALLAGVTSESAAPDLLARLRESDLADLLDVLPRNLAALLAQVQAD
jgi:epoxyqueuosine reductase